MGAKSNFSVCQINFTLYHRGYWRMLMIFPARSPYLQGEGVLEFDSAFLGQFVCTDSEHGRVTLMHAVASVTPDDHQNPTISVSRLQLIQWASET
jgi:hypothetical protein